MTLCEQCGNEYFKKPFEDRETGRLVTQCPYCRWKNLLPIKNKKRGGNNNSRK